MDCVENKNPVCQIQRKNLKILINLIFLLRTLEVHLEEASDMYPGRLMPKYKRGDVENRMKVLHKSKSDSRRA